MIITVLIFIIILGILVFVHEFGHFVMARRNGMKVDEFGFGFPPRLIGFQKTANGYKTVLGHWKDKVIEDGNQTGQAPNDSTIYSINSIPFGGFVKIRGENNEHEEDPRSFINRPFGARFKVLIAGVAMNIILAWVLISLGFIFGIPAATDNPSEISKFAELKDRKIAIMEVVPNLPAAKAGMQSGDIVLFIDNKSFSEVEQIRSYIKSNVGNVFNFKVKRANQEMDIKVASLINPPTGEGPTGIALANVGKLSVPWYIAPWEGAKATISQVYNIITGIYKLITAKLGWGSLGGPIKIAQLTGEVRHMGFDYLMQFTAFLSLNLAVLNILPFPALDGGRVLFLIIEKIRGKKNNQKIEQIANTAGFMFLILLMILVTIKDVKGFF